MPCSLLGRYWCCAGTCCYYPEGTRESHAGKWGNRYKERAEWTSAISWLMEERWRSLKGQGQTLGKTWKHLFHGRILLVTLILLPNHTPSKLPHCTSSLKHFLPSVFSCFWLLHFKGYHQNLPTAVHGVTSQKTAIFILLFIWRMFSLFIFALPQKLRLYKQYVLPRNGDRWDTEFHHNESQASSVNKHFSKLI
jgi:hypothetical protein